MNATQEIKEQIQSLPPALREELDRVGVGEPPISPRNARKLVDEGLLLDKERVLEGRFPVTIYEYEMPLYVHIAYCQVCTEELKEEEQ